MQDCGNIQPAPTGPRETDKTNCAGCLRGGRTARSWCCGRSGVILTNCLLTWHLTWTNETFVLRDRHMCMVMRGVQKINAKTVTSAMLGGFRDDPKTREEFLTFVRTPWPRLTASNSSFPSSQNTTPSKSLPTDITTAVTTAICCPFPTTAALKDV